MILIADGGSTKTTWCLVKKNGQVSYFETEGYNPYFVNSEYITSSLKNNLPAELSCNDITELNYFGAGCFPEKTVIMQDALQAIFNNASVCVDLDLVGAARALLGDGSGFAAILGTGSNTCLFKDGKIEQNIDSLGYFLGDEGSGCYMGRKLLSDYARGYLPETLQQHFFDTYRISTTEILDVVYSQPLINKFCAGFCTFIQLHIENAHIRNIVKTSFHDFFNNLVCHYPGYKNYTFNCVGSIGYIFKDILEEAATRFEMQPGRIIQSPIEGLAEYYLRKV